MIVDIAFAVVPTILGFGATGLIGSAAIRTAKDVMNSISLLRTVGPGLWYGIELQKMRWEIGKRLQQSGKEGVVGGVIRGFGTIIAFDQWIASKVKNKLKKNNQDTQGKQEGQGSGGPPPPPEIKASDRKEEQAKISGIPIDEYAKKKRKEMGLE